MSDRPTLNFSVVAGDLDEVLTAAVNKLERKVLPTHSNQEAIAYFHLSLKLARNTYDTIRYICTDSVPAEGETPARPEYSLSVPPLNRTILDSAINSVFLLEDLPNRWTWFAKAGWREMRIEANLLRRDFGSIPSWTTWIDEHYEVLIVAGGSALGISEAELSNPESIRRWPNPGAMPRFEIGREQELPRSRRLLASLNDVFYGDLSQQSHLSYLGLSKRAGFLINVEGDREERRANLRGYISDQVFMSVTLILILCSVYDEALGLGLTEQIQYLWRLVGGFWDPANLLYAIRFDGPLFDASGC